MIIREVLLTADEENTDETVMEVHNEFSEYSETEGPTVRGQRLPQCFAAQYLQSRRIIKRKY